LIFFNRRARFGENMDLSKKKKKKTSDAIEIQVSRWIGFHVYRSANYFAPFSQWERITDEPIKGDSFSDPYAEGDDTHYYYKIRKVDRRGFESPPELPDSAEFINDDGTRTRRSMESEAVGFNVYRSLDPDLPLDQWERRNEETLPTTDFIDKGIETGVTYYYYVTSVSAAGLESIPSEIISVVGK
jgi:fibronectin type 3 domain-containing protein